MQELVIPSTENINIIASAINALAEPHFIIWFSAIAPLLLSCVAIYISISTARRQNKVALFEKRYELYCFVKTFRDNITFLSITYTTILANNENDERDYKMLLDDYYIMFQNLKLDIPKDRNNEQNITTSMFVKRNFVLFVNLFYHLNMLQYVFKVDDKEFKKIIKSIEEIKNTLLVTKQTKRLNQAFLNCSDIFLTTKFLEQLESQLKN